jgi:hypothetical protein
MGRAKKQATATRLFALLNWLTEHLGLAAAHLLREPALKTRTTGTRRTPRRRRWRKRRLDQRREALDRELTIPGE